MKRLHLIVVFLGIFFIAGCAVNHGRFTVLSNKTIDTSNFNMDKKGKKVVGKDVQHIFIIIPTGKRPILNRAIDNALNKYDGDVLTDVVITSWFFRIPRMYTQRGWEVEGTSISTKK